MKLWEEQSLFMLDLARLIRFCFKEGFTISGGELWRSPEQQEIYVKTGRSKTMNSQHLNRCAIDLVFRKEGKIISDVEQLAVVGDYWESLNPKNRWGGRWKTLKDTPHFERRV